MKFGDCSPPATPTLDEQRDALQKGLGRALQWASSGRLDDEPLLEACLQDQRFDQQTDEPRGDWLWQIVRAKSASERFRAPLLEAVRELRDERNATQLCQLAGHYAQLGDAPFRTRLYEIVEQKPFSDTPWLGEGEVLALDGDEAFLLAARLRGTSLAGREWEWHDGHFVDLAAERLGEQHVNGLLAASVDAAVVRFREGWREDKRSAEARPPSSFESHRERMAAIPVGEVLRAAADDDRTFLRGWGRHAKESDLLAVLEHLWAAHAPKLIANLLRVFSARALPRFDARLIELCRHADLEVRQRAFGALKENADPLIREFALAELEGENPDREAIALFTNNYRRGDEQRILHVMKLSDDTCQHHWMLMDVIKVLEKNSVADGSQLGVVAYASTPCENCRFVAARLLLNQKAAPSWLISECRFDSSEECRKLAEGT